MPQHCRAQLTVGAWTLLASPTLVQLRPPPGIFRHKSLCDHTHGFSVSLRVVPEGHEHTSIASRFASKVTLLAVESDEGGIDDKNLLTLLSSSVDSEFDDDDEDIVDDAGCSDTLDADERSHKARPKTTMEKAIGQAVQLCFASIACIAISHMLLSPHTSMNTPLCQVKRL